MAKVLITGGAGFIGSNLAARLCNQGHEITIFDNLSRSGTQMNADWLSRQQGFQVQFIKADLADARQLEDAVKGMQRVYHLAGQVAVTTSVQNPRKDFEDNALGTFNVLEAVRKNAPEASVLYSSTNKVYGEMPNVKVVEERTRYRYADYPQGISEEMGLDFHSPYGCSKGCGDQYVRDYARIYDLKTAVLRQSCIYGYRQFGIEDQGWLAWFMIAALKGRPISIYGDGKQVRDALFIEDLLDAYDAAVERIETVKGEVFNLGGGAVNTISIWAEFGPLLEEYLGRAVNIQRGPVRPGDQKIFVSDISKAKAMLNWEPKVSLAEGTKRLFTWIRDNQNLFAHL